MEENRSEVFAATDCETCRYNYYKYGSYCNLSRLATGAMLKTARIVLALKCQIKAKKSVNITRRWSSE